MTYLDEWKAISSRIRGLLQAGELHARFLSIKSGDSYNRAAKLREHCESVLSALKAFSDRHEDRIPEAVVVSISAFANKHSALITDASGSRDSQDQRVWAALVLFGGLESEVSFLLTDSQQVIRRMSERAFSHLQRSIVADPDVRSKWIRAFEEGEVSCERLGGLHLLAHGIFAFKINAEGERTDLVFQEGIRNMGESERYAEGFVLTEWKKARSEKEADQQFVSARKQAALYAKGALGASELAAYRYLVVVSTSRAEPPSDVTEEAVTYRHVNIAVDPQAPSRSR